MVSRSWSCCVVLQITSGSWVEFQCPKFWCSSRRKNRPRTRTPQRRQKGNRCNRGMSRLDWRQTFIVAEVASFWSYMILWCYMYIWLPASGNHMGHIMAYFICWEHIGRLMIARYIYIDWQPSTARKSNKIFQTGPWEAATIHEADLAIRLWMCFEHLWTLATVWFGTLASLIGSDIWSSQPQGTRKDSSATLADQNIDFRSVHSWQSLNKETLGAVILDQAAEFHPTAFLAEYDKASLERMSQNVTNVFVDLLLFPFVEARKVGPKSHKASFLRQLHSKKMEDGEEMHFLLAPRCGILGKQIVDRRCFLWSL